jgi:hypothetical protein
MGNIVTLEPKSEAPRLSDCELDHEMFEASCGSLEVIADWLGNVLRVDEDRLPNWYLEDPFVLGFAFSFCGAVRRDWQYELSDADYARDVFIALFGDNHGAVLHRLALDHLGKAQPDFVHGFENGALYHRSKAYPEECGDDPLFVFAQKRAKEHMEKIRKHIPTGCTYEFTFKKYREPACYDAYFMDVLRQRYPDKAEWRQSSLESLPNPDPEDIDYASLSADELRAFLQQDDDDE